MLEKTLNINQLDRQIWSSTYECVKTAFIDEEGEQRIGFFMSVERDDSPLSAMFRVAFSVRMRMALGDAVAEERLVLNEQGHIVGTVIIIPPNYKPMLGIGDPLPYDSQEKQFGCPSVETLLRYNFAEKLIAETLSDNDDAQPCHVSLTGLIEHGMRGYPYTSILGRDRFFGNMGAETTKELFTLKSADLDDFPNIKGRTYFPANTMSANFKMPFFKEFMARANFQALATNPILSLGTGETISFQEQMFDALLKELMVYDPDTLRDRLEEYLGELPLDYLSLSSPKSEALSKMYPLLFNAETNYQPFVDTMMKIFQQKYDELYRVVVFYNGCEKNNSGAPVISFKQYLQNRPSAVPHILKWAKNNHHNPLRLEQRYQQIWRDAYAPMIKNILIDARILLDNLHQNVRISFLSLMSNSDSERLVDSLLLDEHNVKKSQYISYFPNDRLYLLHVLKSLVEKLNKCVDDYYSLDWQKLTLETHKCFYENCVEIIDSIKKEHNSYFYRLNTFRLDKKNMEQFRKFIKDVESFYDFFYLPAQTSLRGSAREELNTSSDPSAINQYEFLYQQSIFSQRNASKCTAPTELQASLLSGFL